VRSELPLCQSQTRILEKRKSYDAIPNELWYRNSQQNNELTEFNSTLKESYLMIKWNLSLEYKDVFNICKSINVKL
jgi:hypothetical protein